MRAHGIVGTGTQCVDYITIILGYMPNIDRWSTGGALSDALLSSSGPHLAVLEPCCCVCKSHA
jgi:hypothetical protein